jgi:hypothetical protein
MSTSHGVEPISKPNDSPCGICGGENNNYDDCGFFYVLSDTVHPNCTDYETWDKEKLGKSFYVPTCGCVEFYTSER